MTATEAPPIDPLMRVFIRTERRHRKRKAPDVSPREEKNNLETYSGRVGALIRERRKAKGITRQKLCEKVTLVLQEIDPDLGEMTYTALRSYETGNRQIPLNLLPVIAVCIGVSVSSLLPRD